MALAGKHPCWIHTEFQTSCLQPASCKTWKVLDPRVAADATMVIETGARSIDFARQCCEELKIPFPDQVVIHVNGPHTWQDVLGTTFGFYLPHVLHVLQGFLMCHSKGCLVLLNSNFFWVLRQTIASARRKMATYSDSYLGYAAAAALGWEPCSLAV